jgi:predicted dehydrogenase
VKPSGPDRNGPTWLVNSIDRILIKTKSSGTMKPNTNAPVSRSVNRREFIRSTTQITAATVAAPYVARGQVLGANERLGVGFIGTGSRAGAHFQSVNWLMTEGKMPLEMVAAYDLYRPRLKRAADAWKAKPYSDSRALLDDPNVDVVCIATPDHHHCLQAIDAVRAGKDVYCEKPVSHWRQFAQIKQLAAEVKRTGRVFQLGTQGMSDSAWRQMKTLIQEGLIGPPIMAECGYFRVGDWGERGMPIDDPNVKPGPDLDWDAFLSDAPKRPFDVSRFFRWRMYEDYAGGPVTDLYPHSLTPVVDMLGLKFPSSVVASGGMFRYTEREVPDTFNLLIDYPEKLTIAVLGTQGNNYEGTGGRGSPGRIPVVRGWEGTLTIRRSETTKRSVIAFVPAEGSKKEAREFPIEGGENLTMHWKNFIECCQKRDPKTSSPADLAYHVQTPLIMGMLAHHSGKTAKFDPAREQIIV